MATDFADHTEITQRVYEYAYGIDLRNWDLYRSIFTDSVITDFSSYNGGPGPQEMTADQWVAGVVPLFTGLDATQHAMTNPIVTVNGDVAVCKMYMQAAHFLNDDPNPEFTIGGYYEDALAHTSNGWRICAVTLNVWWRRGNESIMEKARKRGLALG